MLRPFAEDDQNKKEKQTKLENVIKLSALYTNSELKQVEQLQNQASATDL